MGQSGEAQNITHQQKKMSPESIRRFRDRFNIPVADDKLDEVPYVSFPEGSPELEYMRARRADLGGYLPVAADGIPRAGHARARGVRPVPEELRRPRDLDDDVVRADPAAAAARQEPQPAHRADRSRRIAHLRDGGSLPPVRHLEPAGAAVHAAGLRPADVLQGIEERPDPAGRDQRSGRHVRLDGRRHELLDAWRADDSVLHLLLDVRLPARRRPRLGGGRHALARLPAGRHRRAHDAERRGTAARGRPLAPPVGNDPELHLLRPDVRLRGRRDHPGWPAPDVRRAAATSITTSP